VFRYFISQISIIVNFRILIDFILEYDFELFFIDSRSVFFSPLNIPIYKTVKPSSNKKKKKKKKKPQKKKKKKK